MFLHNRINNNKSEIFTARNFELDKNHKYYAINIKKYMGNFEFRSDYILEDACVLLRPLAENDFDNLLPFSLNEPSIWKFSFQKADGEKNLKKFIQTAIDNRAKKTEYPFIVFDKRTGQYSGSTRFYDMQITNKTTQLGYTWYGKDFQGTGLNKHCKFLLLQFAFEEMQMERVEFRADNNNAKSIAAMLSIGCTAEGVLRQQIPLSDGTRRDTIILSILKKEWKNDVKENLKKRLI